MQAVVLMQHAHTPLIPTEWHPPAAAAEQPLKTALLVSFTSHGEGENNYSIFGLYPAMHTNLTMSGSGETQHWQA